MSSQYRIPKMRVTAAEMAERIEDFNPETIHALRKWLDDQPHYPPTSEEQLILFAHSCYYDVEKSKSCIDNCYNIASSTPEFFQKRDLDLPDVKHILTVTDNAVFPNQTPLTTTLSCTGCKPVRLEGCLLHFGHPGQNCSNLEAGAAEHSFFYSASELEKLYDAIPRDCLPPDFGGTLGKTVAELHAANTEALREMRQYWADQATLVIDETKRPSKKGKKDKAVVQDATPDIRRLELD
ncbi:uncharacterized protein LOC117642986 [Thrips palmi]|uniref:Uncharacterized protein LOC117642986 n=1 Tax=Thrips palmi TaxID=161013 RepID=A0A6P8ZKQ5_THRPL|nr:uncharacterized protein LOC117642986 [Thrips palmi]